MEYTSFEKIQEIVFEDDRVAKKELSDCYAQMEELDKEAILKNDNKNKDNSETETEKITTLSIKSTVNPEKHRTLNVAICENAEKKKFWNIRRSFEYSYWYR